MAVPTNVTLRRFLWLGVAAAGAVWGLGLARTLAIDLHIIWAYHWMGAVPIAFAGAFLAVLVHGLLVRARTDPLPAAMWFLPFFLPLIDLLAVDPRPWRAPALVIGAVVLFLVIAVRPSRGILLLLSVLVPLIVMLPDISPYVGRADTFEFQVIGPQLGIAHPSGYPLYTLLCKLFSLLPVGTVAWRINLSSALFAAMASGLFFLALSELWETDTAWWQAALAWCAAMILAFSPTLWSRAIEAEVYALNALLVALVLWVTVRWQMGALSPDRAWPVLGLLIGLSVASHITLGALGLLAATGLLVRERRPGARAWGPALGLGLMGLALYAYIPLRWPAVTGGERLSLYAFVRFVTNADSGGALRALALLHDPSRWALVGERLLAQVGWGGIALAVVGVVSLALQVPALALGTFLTFAAWIWFGLSFYVADPDYSAFLIPAHMLLIFWLGYGATAIVARLGRMRHRPQLSLRSVLRTDGDIHAVYGHLAVVLLGVLALSRIWQTGPQLDTISQGRADELWARYVLKLPLAEDAAILADSEKFPPLYYLQQVDGIRPDLELVTLFSETQYRADLEARLAAGQVVYLARYLPGMDAFGVSARGPLVEVAPASLTGKAHPSGLAFGDDLQLVAQTLSEDPEGRPMHHLTLTWSVLAPPQDDLEVRLRLTDPVTGRVVWQGDATRPVAGYTTTAAWKSGWEIDDYHPLRWPAWVPSGLYELEVGLFPRFSEQALPVGGKKQAWAAIGSVVVPDQPAAPPGDRLGALYGQAWLLGVAVPAETSAGRALPLDVVWRCGSETAVLPRLEVRWSGVSRSETEGAALEPVGGEGAREVCGPGRPQTVMQRYRLSVPEETGGYRLELGAPLGTVRCGWLQAPTAACVVAEVDVNPATDGLANFGGRIVLVDADVDPTGVPAGGPLRVDLTWRAQQRLDQDYTVFVQVVGPDGQLRGQVDSWPVQGTRPTTSWSVGETVEDPYAFYVEADAPAGEYRVIVGWYLLADMSRLSVLDASGREVGDFRQIGTFTLP